ncbi:Protein of unknown function [Actinopolyspora xinjiangensis]|uniref:DUF3224 domain-containing protein n=1 Tax=Actinopolyspora xinjiangensis TaxID=405564 RepID=A0A1H0WY45_9ACTN|nr:DUF3224 domain-containing protein [Actinopolyspora xinjiangensis]SDP95345.1 Protein of unknown function [Actinopolyspora xinjiangensis]
MTDQHQSRAVEVPFEVLEWDESVYEEPAEGPRLSRVSIRKRYRGALDGTGTGAVLTAGGTTGGGYVVSERFEGALDGHHGTFVLQHGGLADGSEQRTYGTIVPTSGTGELTGMASRSVEFEHGLLRLEYVL